MADHQRPPVELAVLAAEEKGRQWAQWTSIHKHTDLMQARAWFTRGLAVLILAAVVMLASWLLFNNDPTALARNWFRFSVYGSWGGLPVVCCCAGGAM